MCVEKFGQTEMLLFHCSVILRNCCCLAILHLSPIGLESTKFLKTAMPGRVTIPWVPEVFSHAPRTEILHFASAAEGRRHKW